MAEPVIIGVGQTRYAVRRDDVSLQEMIFEAASLALADAGLVRRDLDSVVIGSQDLVDGRGISNMQNAGPAGSYLKDEIRVANDGIYALLLACMQITAGRSSRALVISWAKCSETQLDAVSAAEFEPTCDRPIGLNRTIVLGMQAAALSSVQPRARPAASRIVASARAAGARNGNIEDMAPVSEADVEASSVAAWPLHALDLAPPRDGACALVLSSGNESRASAYPTVSISGMGWQSDPYGFVGDLTRAPSLRHACATAMRRARVSPSDVDLVEISAGSSFEHLVALRDLGIFDDIDVVEAIMSEGADRIAGIAVNPSGGALAANPTAAAGLIRVAEIALQLMGRAGHRQLPEASLGIAHGGSGQHLQSNGVVVLRRN